MTWGDALENINYWAAVVAAVASLVLGAVWYSRGAFGKEWMRLVGLKDKDVAGDGGTTVSMVTAVVLSFIGAVVLSSLLYLTDMQSGGNGILMGALVGLAAGFGPLAVTYAFARRKPQLTLIDGGYILVQFVIMGWIVGAWV